MFTNPNGDYGELLVAKQLKQLDRKEYTLLNDITLKYKTLTTQIDHILLSSRAIYVIETKALTGQITTSNTVWTQKINRKKVEFMNPYKQNDYHIDILVKISGIPKSKFLSLVVFTEDDIEIHDSYNFSILNLNTLNAHIIQSRNQSIQLDDQVRLIRAINLHLCSLEEHIKNMQK